MLAVAVLAGGYQTPIARQNASLQDYKPHRDRTLRALLLALFVLLVLRGSKFVGSGTNILKDGTIGGEGDSYFSVRYVGVATVAQP